jgi:signal transduction histidine kinase
MLTLKPPVWSTPRMSLSSRLSPEGLAWWRVIVYGIIGNTLIAVVLLLAGVHDRFSELWITSQSIGFSILVLHLVLSAVLDTRRWTTGVMAAAVAGGVPLGVGIASVICGPEIGQEFIGSAPAALRYLGFGAIFSLPFFLFFRHREHIQTLEKAQRETELRVAEQQRAAVTAELRRLQAQIEPHFLFNTLANVRSLIDRDPPAARDLLEQLNAHLRAGLKHSRASQTTLAEEFRLLESYLRIQAHRMGPRFRWQLDLPAELRDLPFPPMLLQPLVENAVRHGIEPKVGDGKVTLTARRQPGGLTLTVADDGLGIQPSSSAGGFGLANIRERLLLLFGPDARLDLKENNGLGLTAELWIPQNDPAP